MKAVLLILSSVLLIIFASCGRGLSFTTSPAYVYVAESGPTEVFSLDPTSGALAAISGSPFSTGAGTHALTPDPLGRFLYFINVSIYGFSLDPIGSTLSAITGSPFSAPPSAVTGLTTPSGKFFYAPDTTAANVFGYAIGTNGVLTTVSGSPFAIANISFGQGAIDPSGTYLYVPTNANTIAGYTVNPTSGFLTGIAGSPFPAPNGPDSTAMHPSGNFLYAENGSNRILGFLINRTTGDLSTPLTGSPFTYNHAGMTAYTLAMDPLGKFLYAGEYSSTGITGFVIDGTSGNLTSTVPGSPFTCGTQPNSLTFDPSGTFLIASNQISNNLSVFRVNRSTGALTQVSGSPFALTSSPQNAFIVRPSFQSF